MIIDCFDIGASQYPDRIFVRMEDADITYRDAEAASHAIAYALRQIGLDGKHVGLLSPNNAHALTTIVGIVRSGATYVPLNAADSIESISQFIEFADVAALICNNIYQPHVEELRRLAPSLKLIVGLTAEIEPGGSSIAAWMCEFGDKRVEKNKGLDDIAIIKSSGGTTGQPKAIMQTHRSLEVTYRILNQFCRPKNEPVHLIVAPITHVAGASALALAQFGTTNVIARSNEPGSLLKTLAEEGITHVFLPPTLIYRLLAHPYAVVLKLPRLECIVYGAAPMSADKLKQGLKLWGQVFVQIYGQAEVPGVITLLSRKDHSTALEGGHSEHLQSAGRPTGACEVVLMTDEGKVASLGERGEIVARGELVTPGYYNNPEANAQARAFGWHHTGDIGVFDENGYLYIVDRKKDMIISGGFNVYPSEIEQIIWSHPAVQDCAVVGVPDPDWGERVTAVIQLNEGQQVSADEIIKDCKSRLGSIKAPKQVIFWDDLPRSAVGKVLKTEVRAKLSRTLT